jgi:hypothetical protein
MGQHLEKSNRIYTFFRGESNLKSPLYVILKAVKTFLLYGGNS